MGLSKDDEKRAIANAKNEISAFSDMYNRCVATAHCGRGQPAHLRAADSAPPAGWSSSASKSASRASTTRS